MVLLSRCEYGNMEAHGSFYGVYSRKLQFVGAMETSTFTESETSMYSYGTFYWLDVYLIPRSSIGISVEVDLHPRLPLKLPSTQVDICGSPLTSMEEIYVRRSFHGAG